MATMYKNLTLCPGFGAGRGGQPSPSFFGEGIQELLEGWDNCYVHGLSSLRARSEGLK